MISYIIYSQSKLAVMIVNYESADLEFLGKKWINPLLKAVKSSYVDQYPEDLVNCTGELEISSVSG